MEAIDFSNPKKRRAMEAIDFSNSRKKKTVEVLEELPEEILHHILSISQVQEAAKTTVLSKLWRRLWQTQPILHCDETYFPSTEKFVNYVNSSLLRYQENKISMEKLKIICKRYFNGYYSSDPYWTTIHLDRWMGIGKEIGLKKLELVDVHSEFSLPPIVFEAEQLEDLSISFYPSYAKQQIPKKISCLRLKRLSFSRIFFINKGTLERILSICQCIESLYLRHVNEYERKLKVQLPNLKELRVISCKFWRLEVEAPNLEVLTCLNCSGSGPCLLDLKTTQNLKFLKLFCTNLYGCNQFPKLEKLIIQDCSRLNVVDCCSALKYILVDSMTNVSFTNLSPCSISNIRLNHQDSIEFLRLKKLLRNLMPSRISLRINTIIDATRVAESFNSEEEGYKLPIPVHELSLGKPPPSSSTFTLNRLANLESLDFSTVLYSIFWTCRPTLIKVGTSPFWYTKFTNEFTKFLVRKLMVRRDEYDCDSQEIWMGDLKEVKVDFYTKNEEEEWRPESWDLETFVDMISKVQVLICITCNWERSSYVQGTD